MRCRTLLVFTFMLLFYAIGVAQPKAFVQHYSTENGLSHITVSFMLKDQQGFMWFGTWDGINRFDGRTFTNYKSFAGDDSPLKSHRIDQIIEGDADELWVRAFDRQVYRFTKSSGTFFPLAPIFMQKQHQRFDFSSIIKAKNNQLWLRTEHDGLIYFPDAKNSPSTYFHYSKNAKGGFKLPDNKINFFHQGADSKIWIGTPKGLVCLAKSNKEEYSTTTQSPIITANLTDAEENSSILYFPTDKGELYIVDKKTTKLAYLKITPDALSHAMITRSNKLLYLTTNAGGLIEMDIQSKAFRVVSKSDQPLRSIHEDSAGNLWLEPANTGVFRYNPTTKNLSFYRQETDTKYKLSGNHFRIFEDDRKRVWVNMKSGGFGYFDKQKDRVAYFFNDPNDRDHRFSNNVISFLYDNAGVMWLVSDEKGLEKIVFQENDFRQQLLVNPGRFRSDNEVRGLAMDSKQRLWVGGKSGKLYLIENGRKRTNFITNIPAKGLGQVYSIRQDASGVVWLGTKADGLYVLTPTDKSQESYQLTHFQEAPNGLIANEIYSTVQDGYGRIWLGTYGKGLQVMVPENGRFKFISQQTFLSKLETSSFNKVRQLSLDKDGRIWAATTDGLVIIEAEEDILKSKFKTYSKQAGRATSLGNNDVQYVYKDVRGRMWLATSGGGLSMAMGNDPLQALKFSNYSTKDGLANGYIVSLSEGNDGNLWLASQNGLTRFNTSTRHFRNYSSLDGLPKVIFSESACVRTNDSLIFGSNNGLVSFAPARIKDHRIKAPLAFTGIQVNNSSVGHGRNGIVLAHELNNVKELRLKYNENVLNFDYNVLDYRSGDKQVYTYRLNGFDSTWHNNEGQPRATYTNLPPGNYTFEARCISNGLYSNVPYKSINISISSPPWRTWWAYIIYAIIISVAFFLVRRTVITMINLRNKIAVEQELAALKLRFFTNVSHELRTPLTLIVNPINAIAESEQLSAKGKSYLQVVQSNADRMVRFINQLLDLRKVESGNATLNLTNVEVVSFIRNITEYFDGIAAEKQIKLEIAAQVDAVTCLLDPEKFETVIYNILGNAFKFSETNKNIHIRIDVDTLKSMLIISIQDQAGGMPANEINDMFELYYEGSAHHQSKGTGIGLALAKELVGLHGGIITAENNQVGGLTMSISLKLESGKAETRVTLLTPELNTAADTISETTTPVTKEDADKPLILLVEDHPELNQFLASQLSEAYRVAVAENGVQGLQLAQQLSPDLILSDVMMPEMDGIEMLVKLKEDGNTSHIPVILLSARQSVESQIEGLKYGADYYITKPFNNLFLMTTIQNIVNRRKQDFQQMLQTKKRTEFNPAEVAITTHDEEFLRKVIRLTEEKMAYPEFKTADLVAAMNMSRTAFYNKFKSLTDTAPVEFLREMRVKRGKQYLDAGESNISVVAYNVGFENARYFSSCFKEYYKVTPTEYLKAKA